MAVRGRLFNMPTARLISSGQRIFEDTYSSDVPRTGAVGPINSVYLRDPDANLIEVCNYERLAGKRN